MESDTETSTCIAHEPCPSAGREIIWPVIDGHGYCFGCGYYEKGEEMQEAQSSGKVFGFPVVQQRIVKSKSVFTKVQSVT